MHPKLQAIVELLPAISEAALGSMIVAVTDTERFLAYEPAAELDVNIKPGDPVSPQGSTYEALRTGRTVIAEISGEASPVPYVAVTSPIVSDGAVIGSFATGYPLKRERELRAMSQDTAASIQQTSASVESLLEAVRSLAANAQTLNDLSAKTLQTAGKADEVADFIKDVADSTQLLGLNAAIESAHAGEFGKGFGVVAQEIRKMASSNKEAAKTITQFVRGLQESIGEVASQANELGALSEELSASLQEISLTVDRLSEMSGRLLQLSEIRAELVPTGTFSR